METFSDGGEDENTSNLVPATYEAQIVYDKDFSDDDSSLIPSSYEAPTAYGQSDDEEDSTLIPASYEAHIVHGQKPVLSLAFDAQGSKFATGGQNFAVQLFDFLQMDSSMKPFREIYPAETHTINSLAYSSNGETLLVGSSEAQIHLIDRQGKQWAETVRGDQYLVDLGNTKGHTAAVNHLCWHPFNKKEFLSCSDDGSLRIWDTDDFKNITKCINTQKKVIKTRNAGGKRVIPTTCCYSRDGKLIAAGCDDGSIQIWKHGHFASVKYVNRNAHMASVCCLEFSPDSKQILSRGMDDTLKLFDIEKFKEPVKQVENLPCMFVQSSCGYSPHGEFVFATTSMKQEKTNDSGSLLFFNSSSFEQQYRIEYDEVGAVSCFWHPKLDQILVGLTDGTCRLYYDSRSSVRGALLCATRPVKRVKINEVVTEDKIIAPLAHQMFQPRGEEGEEQEVTEWRLRRILRMQSGGNKKPKFRKPAEMPMAGSSAGGRLAKSGGTLHSYIAQAIGVSQNQTFIQDEDIRASILRHAEAAEKEPLYISKAYKRTQPKPIFQEDEDDDQEPEYKVAILNTTTRKLSSAITSRPSLVTTANDGREALARNDPAKLRPDLLFFGENYRTCFEWVHIVEAAKIVVLLDFLKLTLELNFFVSKVGYLDSFHVLHLIWAIGGGIGAIVGFWQERFFLFWPLLALKATKFIFCLFTAVLLFILFIAYRPGLRRLLKWNYPRVEDTASFSILLFCLCIIFLALDGYIFDVLYRVQVYFRRKAMAIYFMERQEIISIFV